MSTPQGPRPGDRSDPEGSGTTPPGPLTEADDLEGGSRTGSESGPREHTPRINPARMEVRVRRIALLGLVLVPLIYFVVQSLR
ncbi:MULTISPECIES: hypothetical protein [Kocuria]|uniref:hypothetical protein n=1 Tax=Kocuria TaxID=57493 RepID=UPI0021A5C005|nr:MULTISPECIES: hypothetical protein [Kocuria]MCT1546393.1 hypothetical protein [Kocuria rhizophila]MCT2170735.1 hypothetical protein [Kocuria rhizophila]MDA4829819.1 hypothetical protein [Kocuria rhizophila]MDN3463219.1 hypothetical protein [Kocuria sp. APC 4018]WSQ05939.1 hypothetical protein OG312_04495 [Kocuria rhizophila]